MSSLANIFGRKASLATSVVVFALGSLITALATSMKMAIGGRAVQGAGGAGLLCLAQIVVVDLVPLAKRGLYIGLLSAVWSVASTVGPCIAGALGVSDLFCAVNPWLNLLGRALEPGDGCGTSISQHVPSASFSASCSLISRHQTTRGVRNGAS